MKTTPYGAWQSPITTDLIVAGSIGLGTPTFHLSKMYWIESRPQEAGRNVLVQRDEHGHCRDVNPSPFNIRTRVHEYGGDAWLLYESDAYFVNFADQQVYKVSLEAEAAAEAAPEQLTFESHLRFANGTVDTIRQRIIYVIEDHSGDGEASNTLGAVSLSNGSVSQLIRGHDFFSSPSLSADGQQLAYMTWDHPDMPWDESIIWKTSLSAEGDLDSPTKVAGGKLQGKKVSVQQPRFSPDGTLFYISDETGWWNIHREGYAEPVVACEAEFGSPHWGFGLCSYLFDDHNTIRTLYLENNVSKLARLDIATGVLRPIAVPRSSLAGLSQVGHQLAMNVASYDRFSEIVLVDGTTGEILETIASATTIDVSADNFSIPQTITYPTAVKDEAHAFYYPPHNPGYTAPDGTYPPLVVMFHGGPTGATSNILSLRTQYWTTRGFAVLDVNYRGSTGYGRAYRDKLLGQWGIVDVEDAVAGAQFLAERGKADINQLAIRGGSAGGYTVLAAITFTDVFSAGASHYGISDLEALAQDTHKFESRYLDSMIGRYPEDIDIYRARSPIHHTDQLNAACIFFQGLEDQVVPPNQAEMMVDVLRAKGLPVAYVPFAGEQHGFRQAQNIKRSLELEYYFYARVFGFEPADAIDPVKIDNLTP
jgi:dipeptidyl aminopeptidase/acylaminoacyl peptidase